MGIEQHIALMNFTKSKNIIIQKFTYYADIKDLVTSDGRAQEQSYAWETDLVTCYGSSEEISSRSTELYLLTDICQIIMSDVFCSYISQFAILMKLYYGILNKLQTNKAQLHDVALSFKYFIKFWKQNTDRFISESIISCFIKKH
ncbi:hypothetical protein C1646_775867 [Rhizophagus diaphanus]|nr:hypothetical protein C1646_775867 [Rhizophagus diaphanus] [Rhizophagus sp. MUCL 43196]